jgi:hypothetical protein
MRKVREESDAIHHPDNPFMHPCNVEIQDVTELEAAEAKIAQKLPAMNGKDRLDRLLSLNHDLRPDKLQRFL